MRWAPRLFSDSSPSAAARSLLVVPATRPERFAKALACGADGIVLDLEDAMPADRKDTARATLVAYCAALALADLARVLVRVNAAGTPWHEADLGMRCQAHETELAFARFRIVAASRRCGLAAPLDGRMVVLPVLRAAEAVLRQVRD